MLRKAEARMVRIVRARNSCGRGWEIDLPAFVCCCLLLDCLSLFSGVYAFIGLYFVICGFLMFLEISFISDMSH